MDIMRQNEQNASRSMSIETTKYDNQKRNDTVLNGTYSHPFIPFNVNKRKDYIIIKICY